MDRYNICILETMQMMQYMDNTLQTLAKSRDALDFSMQALERKITKLEKSAQNIQQCKTAIQLLSK